MKRTIAYLLLASAAFAQPEARKPLTVSFSGGPVLELHTESSAGTSPLSTGGSVEIGAGNDAHRFVLDANDRVIFGYYIETRNDGQGAFTIRIKPFDRQNIRQESSYLRQNRLGDVPTLGAAREFTGLHIGDAVQVDILYNPSTGERLYDVIKVAPERRPPPSAKASKPTGEKFSLRGFRVDVNGKTVRETSDVWMIGGGLLISLRGRGDYYFGLTPCSETPCRLAAWVDHNTLRFYAGSDLVEVIAQANVLQSSNYATLWMYHDPQSKVRATGDPVDFTCADDVDSLTGYKKAQKE